MKTQTKRIQPYDADDGDYITLVNFILEISPILSQEFAPPTQWSEKTTESVPYERDVTTLTFGNEQMGVNIKHKKGYEPKYAGHAEDEVSVTCFGFPEGMTLEIMVLRFYYDPRYIEIIVTGPSDAVDEIVQRFETRFKQGVPDETKLARLLRAAKAATRVHAWRAAELNAAEVLIHESDNPEAMMYLGIARAAQGYEPEGENLLLASLTLDPKNQDAYYNLGLLALNQGRCLFASDAFRHGLGIDSSNHPLWYQLGRALERLGKENEALDAYRKALEFSPNPDQAWGYSGLDFTASAQEAIKRLTSKTERSTSDKEKCSQ